MQVSTHDQDTPAANKQHKIEDQLPEYFNHGRILAPLAVGTTQADRPLFGEGGWFVDNGDRGKCNICGEIRMKNGGSGKKNAGTSNLRAHLRCHHNLPGSGKPKELGVTHGTSTTDLCVLKDLVCKPLNFFRNIKCLYNVSHQQSMMDKIAVFFCQNKIALQVVEDPTFTGITSAPAGVTRRSLLAHIEKLGNTCRQKLLKRFEGDDVTIMFDGATLPGKRRVLNFSIHNGHMALFLNFDKVGSNGLGAFGSCPIPDVNFLFIFIFF